MTEQKRNNFNDRRRYVLKVADGDVLRQRDLGQGCATAPDVGSTALDPYIWRGANMPRGGIHSSEKFWVDLAQPDHVLFVLASP